MKRLFALALYPALAFCQSNLKFQEGVAGQIPPGWFALDAVKDSGYTANWLKEGCRSALPCAQLAAPASPPPQSFGAMMQSFDAQPFRGKKVRLRAWIKLERKSAGDHAQMLLRVGRPGAQQAFLDNMADRPIVFEDWRRYEILGNVAPDADAIRIGILLYGQGRAWVSEVEFGPVTEELSGPAVDAAREAIQQQYTRIDSAFTRGAVAEIAAVVMPDAQMGVGTIREPLLAAIEGEIAKGGRLTARTTVTSVKLDGEEAVAVVRREAKDPTSDGKRTVVTSHRDRWLQTATGWRWRESIEVSYHWILPPTDIEMARPVVNELKMRAVPLLTAEDLVAFGRAVGDARVVVLGEAAHGTREFPQWKQRMVEYLVKQKGFTVIAAANEPDVHELVDRLHATFARFDGATTEAQAASIGRLANTTHVQAKMVVWTDNVHARDPKLREILGRRMYSVGFTFHRGEVRAVGVEGGESRGLGSYTATPSPEGSGDAILSAAGIPQFFLPMSVLPGSGPLARWLADLHLFHDLGAYWVVDDPDASLQPEDLSKCYDGLIFLEEVHGGG